MPRRHAPTIAFRFTRAGNIDPNPLTLVTKAGSAARLVRPGSTFVTVREESGLGHYFVAEDDGGQESTAFALAQAVSARSEQAEVPDLSRVASIAHLEFQRGTEPGNNTQAGAEIGTVVDSIATSLRPGEWVAASVRQPTKRERDWHKIWLNHRGTHTHHSLNTNAVIMSLWVGSQSAGNAKSLLRRVAAALPGFDLHTVPQAATQARGALPWLATAALAGVAGFSTTQLAPVDNGWWWYVAAGVLALAAALTAAGRLPSKLTRLRRRMWSGLVPAAARRVIPPRRPSPQRTTKEGTVVPAEGGDYPLMRPAFMVGALLPLSVIAPHAGAESGVSSTKERAAPPALRERIGPMIGANHGLPVFLDIGDFWQGLMCVGQAGSGKSALLQALWGWMVLDRHEPTGLPGAPGRNHTLIAFDTKGDGLSASEYVAWSNSVGDNVLRIDVADTTQPFGIDLFPAHGTAEQRARRVVTALKYVYGETSIGPESFDTLGRVLHAAFVITPDIAAQVDGIDTAASPFYFANVLLTNRGDELGRDLAGALIAKAVREKAEPGSDLYDAAEGLKPIYDPARTVAQRQQLMKAPRTKVAAMMAAEHWWARPKKTSWERILTAHAPVVINTGIAPNGQTIDKELQAQLSALFLFSLHEEIQRHCVGWFEQGRAVSIFADELKQLAGTSPDVITWFRNDARSFGVRAVFATQYPEQLDRDVRDAVMGFGTFIAYAQSNPDMIATIVKHLQTDGSEWTSADIDGLPKFEAVVKTRYDGRAQTPFTTTIPNFRAERGEQFALTQGFA